MYAAGGTSILVRSGRRVSIVVIIGKVCGKVMFLLVFHIYERFILMERLCDMM